MDSKVPDQVVLVCFMFDVVLTEKCQIGLY